MPRKVPLSDHENICNRYSSGETSGEIAKDFGVSISTIALILKKNGIVPDGRKPKTCLARRIVLPTDEIVGAYSFGESENAISKRFEVSRNVVRRVLVESGIKIRGSADANRLMMSKRTREENVRNTLAANAASRGKSQPEERLQKIALGRQRGKRNIGPKESPLISMLVDEGFRVTPQKACGRYNIDVSLDEFSIAVEVFGGNWHTSGNHARRFRERTDYILNAGNAVVIVWVGKEYPLGNGVIQYLRSLADRVRGGESLVGQEHVIRGDGEPCSIGKDKLEYRSIVGGNSCGDLVRGKDGRFRREAARV